MASGFVAAVKAVMTYRPRGTAPFDPTAVTGAHAAIGIVIALVVQLALVVLPLLGARGGALVAVLPDLLLVTLLSLAVPYVVVTGVAAATGTRAGIPAAFLYLSIMLLLLQIVFFVLSQFIASGGGASLGVLAFIVFYTCRQMLGLSVGISILAGVLAVVGTFAAGALLLVLPTGQALLSAA